MRKQINRTYMIPLLLCLIPFILSAVYYSQLPEQVAIHFDSNGNPDNYAPKLFAAFGPPLIMLVVYVYSWFRYENDPKGAGASPAMKLVVRWAIPLLAIVMQLFILTYAVGIIVNPSLYGSLLVGLLIVAAGNYLPKCRQNYTIGIKLPWTLHDENNWKKTHYLAGWVWVAGGFLLVVNALLEIPWLSIAVIALLVLIPFIYSYSLYRRTVKAG